jgi:type IV pilus assembly protein PilV
MKVEIQQLRGFSLMEVLVALLVLSIGLLGLAALQTTGLKFNHQSYERTQATLQAYDIFDSIRANKNNNSVTNTTFDSVALNAQPGTTNCASVTCTDNEMAQYNIRQWNIANNNLLPEGKGAICRGTFTGFNCTVGGAVYRVAIQWKENDVDMRLDVETLI